MKTLILIILTSTLCLAKGEKSLVFELDHPIKQGVALVSGGQDVPRYYLVYHANGKELRSTRIPQTLFTSLYGEGVKLVQQNKTASKEKITGCQNNALFFFEKEGKEPEAMSICLDTVNKKWQKKMDRWFLLSMQAFQYGP